MINSMKETAEFGFWLMAFIGIWSIILVKWESFWAYLIGAVFLVLFAGQGVLHIIHRITWTFF